MHKTAATTEYSSCVTNRRTFITATSLASVRHLTHPSDWDIEIGARKATRRPDRRATGDEAPRFTGSTPISGNNIINLAADSIVERALRREGWDLTQILEEEPDAGLGDQQRGGDARPRSRLARPADDETREALDLIVSDHCRRDERGVFAPIRDALLARGDHYMHLADLPWYVAAQQRVAAVYADASAWAGKATPGPVA
jgi:glucan phosphorylase